MEETDLEIKRIPLGLLETTPDRKPKVIISPVLEFKSQGHDQPIDCPGASSQAFKTTSIDDQFFAHVTHKRFWKLLAFVILCGQLYQYAFRGKILLTCITWIAAAIYWYQEKANDRNIEKITHKVSNCTTYRRALLHQLNSPKSPTDDQSLWLRNIITKLWPYVNGMAQQQMDKRGLSSRGVHHENTVIYIEQFTLGIKPPRISSTKINTTGIRVDETVIDFKLDYFGDCMMTIGRNPQRNLNLHAGVDDVHFQCDARIWLRPSLMTPPFFGGIVFCLLNPPLIDFRGISLTKIIDSRLVKTAIVHVISTLMVDPNRFYISIAHQPEVRRRLVWPAPIALCYIRVFRARNLPQSRRFHLQSNPYCRIRVGSNFFETLRVSDASNPVWNETRITPVHDYCDEVRIEIFDSDVFTYDTSIGEVSFKIRDVVNDRCTNGLDKWHRVRKTKNGELHMLIMCLPLASNFNYQLLNRERISLLQKDIPSGLMHLFIHDIKADVALDDNHKGIRPYILIRYAGKSHATQPVSAGAWTHKLNAECCFESHDPSIEAIEFIVIDQRHMSIKKSRKVVNFDKADYLASTSMKTKELLKQPNMAFDGILKIVGATSYDITLYAQFLVCETSHEIFKNLQQPVVEHVKRPESIKQ